MTQNFVETSPCPDVPALEGRDAGSRPEERALLALLQRSDTAGAYRLAQRLTTHLPERGLPWKVLGALLWAQGRTAEALAAMRRSVRLLPRDAEAHCNLGLTLAKSGYFAEAEAWLLAAIAINPRFATAHYRLGMTYSLQARLPEAAASLRSGIALRANYTDGDDALNYSNLLFILSHDPALEADALFAEHRRFGEYFENCAAWPTHTNSREPERCLKVGFVSGDLRAHAVAGFIEPLLAQLAERQNLEVHAYYSGDNEDAVSRRIRSTVRSWCPVAAVSNPQLAAQVMDDGIDVLIDLSGHTAHNRLPAFAAKPAPVQASWIGYPGTTGLLAMDYFLADPYFLPPGEFDRYFTEQLVYLPAHAPFCPHESAPPVNALPALATGQLTFGSFNRPDKINASTIRLWAGVLRALPETRMMLGGIPLESQRSRLLDEFAACGIARERLTVHPPVTWTATWRCIIKWTCAWIRRPTTGAPPPFTPCGWEYPR